MKRTTLDRLATVAIENPNHEVSNGHHWYSNFETERWDGLTNVLTIRHYATTMFVATRNPLGEWYLIELGTGHGSVSDQNGLNNVFADLNLPIRYDRNQPLGPRFTRTNGDDNGNHNGRQSVYFIDGKNTVIGQQDQNVISALSADFGWRDKLSSNQV